MPRHESSRYKLSHGWLRGEDWWGDPVSDNFLQIDMLLHPYVISMTETTPPISGLAVGDMYLVPADALLDWSGHTNELAVYDGVKWIFCAPTRGVRARLDNPASWIWFNGDAWLDESRNSTDDPDPALQGTKVDVAVFVSFEAEPGEMILAYTPPEAMTLPDGAAGSVGRCETPPNGIIRFSVKRNGAVVGTIAFVSTGVKAEFTVAGNKVFAKGDFLSVHVPDNPPAGFHNYAMTLRLIMQNSGG
jgi:hypothetical protein